MKYILEYQELITNLIPAANSLDIPFEGLLAHKKEVDKYVQQLNCEHDPRPINNKQMRLWRCIKCDKFIDNETIRN